MQHPVHGKTCAEQHVSVWNINQINHVEACQNNINRTKQNNKKKKKQKRERERGGNIKTITHKHTKLLTVAQNVHIQTNT